MVSSSSSDSVPDLDPVIVEMADNTMNETGFPPAQLRAISDIIAAAFAQERAQNQVPPASSNQPIVEEREAPEPALGNQASADNVSPVENDLIKHLAELKDKVEKISASKEKDPVTNFHVAEYVLKPTSSTSAKTFKHTLFEGDNDPRAGLNIEELYKEEEKKNRGFGNYRSSHSGQNRSAGNAAMNQSGSSNIVGDVNEKVKREFTDLGRPLSTVMRSCIKNGVLSRLPINPSRPIRGRFLNQDCEYHQCKGHSTDNCFQLKYAIQDLIDSGKVTKPPEHSKPTCNTHRPIPEN
ncbi:hypothetical protein JCGZ_16399 [Jatropha curcas]|uniref:Uncharacterized protein n=1 Tax=Jatropha curcas TaxID=180498 RepID=A0A067K3J5_JATCU|nr:hypothetical protein JCGZ_16399 [Jatropha curcas]